MSAIRPQRVASAIHRAVQKALEKGLSDPRIRGVITVTGVRVSPDLKHAVIRVSIYPEQHEAIAMHGLQSAARRIRHTVSDEINLPRTPEFRFELDRGLKAQAQVLEALRADAEIRARGVGWIAPPAAAATQPSQPRKGKT